MDIIFNDKANKYQLILADQVIKDLELTDDNGKPLGIFHQNKLNLEWLHRDIEQRHNEILQYRQKSEKTRKRKLTILFVILLIVIIAFLFRDKIAGLAAVLAGMVNILFGILILMSCWTILQTYILSRQNISGNLADSLKTIQLKESIVEQFSFEG